MINVEITDKKKENQYPWIGVSKNGTIVLFTGENCGTVIKETPEHTVGTHLYVLNMDNFEPFTGEITLSNAL